MTDKERLEGIKEEYKWHVENQLLPRMSVDNFEWLIEQAERVEELGRVNKQLKDNLSVYKGYYKNMMKINEGIVEENKHYRETLWDINIKLRDLFVEVWDMDKRKLQGEFYKMSKIIQNELEESE